MSSSRAATYGSVVRTGLPAIIFPDCIHPRLHSFGAGDEKDLDMIQLSEVRIRLSDNNFSNCTIVHSDNIQSLLCLIKTMSINVIIGFFGITIATDSLFLNS